MAAVVIVILITFFNYSGTIGSSKAVAKIDTELAGAVPQVPAKAPPPPHHISEELPKKTEEQKKKEADDKKKAEDAAKPTIFDIGFADFAVDASDLTSDPDGPKPEEIVVLTASDGKGHNNGIENLMEKAQENRQAFCDYHGYIQEFINISKYNIGHYHPVWAKLPAIAEAFHKNPKAKWVWWLDLDAIVMTPSIDLNKHVLSHKALLERLDRNAVIKGSGGRDTGHKQKADIDPANIDIIVAQDHNGLNAGSFLMRRSPFTKLLLDLWADPQFRDAKWEGQEQTSLIHLVEHHKALRERTAYVPQRVFNAYSVGGGDMGWKTGDLVVHFAGCWVNKECNTKFNDFWSRREIVDGKKKQLEPERSVPEKPVVAENVKEPKQKEEKSGDNSAQAGKGAGVDADDK